MRLKTLLPSVLALFTFAFTVNAATVSFSDISNSPYKNAILHLAGRSIIQGYDDGTFRPLKYINRAELLKILVESEFSTTPTPEDLKCFTDVQSATPQWYSRAVCLGKELGIVQGYPDGTFKPGQPVMLAEAMKMAFKTYRIAVPAPRAGEQWFTPYMNAARERKILLNRLGEPGSLATRGEVASIASVLLTESEESPQPTGPAICGNGALEAPEQCDDGNTQDSDGCSSICVLVSEPIRQPFVNISQDAAGTLTTIAQGQKNQKLLRFTAVAARQDALLTRVVFSASVGSLVYGSNYTLAMDRDRDGTFETIAQAGGTVSQNLLIFDKMVGGGVALPEQLSIPFEVRADLTGSMGSVPLGIEFATHIDDYIDAQGAVDGIDLDGIETDGICESSVCWIRVVTTGSTDINIVERGNLFISKDSTPLPSHQWLLSSIAPAALRLRLHATGEDIDVRKIRISGGTDSIESLLLYRLNNGQSFDQNSQQPFAQATTGQCETATTTRFCVALPLSTLRIDTEQDAVIVVVPKMKPDSLGGQSGENIALSVNPLVDTNSRAFDARGVFSQQDLAQSDGDSSAEGEIFIGTVTPSTNTNITGSTNDTVLSMIGSIANGKLQSTVKGIPVGATSFAAFTLHAPAHQNTFHGSNDVVVKTIRFHVQAQNVQIDPLSYKLSTSEDPGSTMSCSAGVTTGSFTVTCSNIDSGSVRSRIGQAQSVTYQLTGTVTNPAISSNTTSILVGELLDLGQRSATSAITWSDEENTLNWVDVPYTSVQSTIYRSN